MHDAASTDRSTLAEALDDFRLALVSRFCDDREIALRQQNRAFFQISGAGHEALLLGLARSLRAGYDWFFPYYRDRALVLALGVTPERDADAGGRRGRRSRVGRAPDAVSLGSSPRSTSSAQTSVHRRASVCPRSAARRRRATSAGVRNSRAATAYGDELTYVSLGEGATSEGEFWESLNTACRLHLPVLFVVADNGYAISVRSTDQAPAPRSRRWCAVSAGCTS